MTQNLDYLQELVKKPEAVNWFKGLFKQVHLEIADTGEKFTITHSGDHAEVLAGFQGDHPNFVVPLQSGNIQRLSAAFTGHEPTDFERYRIVKFMLKPCLQPLLTMPVLSNKAVVQVLKIETHWQEALLDPDGREDEQLTVVYVNNQWLVIPGYHGTPQRRMVFKPDQVLEFIRRVFEADSSGNINSWVNLATWYVKWREEITVPVN
jgi:hypothetical protein